MKSPENKSKSIDDIDSFDESTFTTQVQMKLRSLKEILGEEISTERIRHYLRGADGNIEIAINHILNEIEKERSSTPVNTTEKILYDLAEEVKCPLCLSYFQRPLILSCFHTFCASCLQNLVTSDNSIQCPLCRNVVTLDPERGLGGLKINHYLANIVEKLKGAQATKMCDECRKVICTVFCKQCKAFLCNCCNDKIHSIRLLLSHNRIPFEECFFPSPYPPHPVGLELNDNVLWESDSVIPFNVKIEVCTDLFYSWVKELWFAPSDLAKIAVLQDFKMIYIPYWLFEVETSSQYIVTYSDKLLGSNSEVGVVATKHSDITICASSSCMESPLLEYIEPWKVDQMQSFTLKHAEGSEIRPITIDSENAWRSKAKAKVDQLNRDACRKQLRYGNVRPESVSKMHLSTTFANRKSKRLFVPVYSCTYEYRGRSFMFIVNGSTAKAYGTRPYSTSKLASMSLTGIGAALGLLSSARLTSG